MDIAQVARRSGVPASTLRYYEEKGLIASVGRDGLRRRFADDVLDQLALISLGQSFGFSLDEIGAMFPLRGGASIDRAALASKADEIDETIRRLSGMSEGLRHAAACPARTHMECPTFQRLLRDAGARSGKGADHSANARISRIKSLLPSNPIPGNSGSST